MADKQPTPAELFKAIFARPKKEVPVKTAQSNKSPLPIELAKKSPIKKGEDEYSEPKKKDSITEFENSSDWMITMILVAAIHANPELPEKEAMENAIKWARQVSLPNKEHLWGSQLSRIQRFGIRAEASKIRREMFKLL